jgi:porphobilinogen deaminase
LVAHPDGRNVLKGTLSGKDEKAVGEALARELIDRGAKQLLLEVREGLVG